MQILHSIRSFFKEKDQPQILVVLLFIVFALMLVIENINGRFWLNDFKVMYSAAEAFVSGEQVYGKPFGLSTGFFKYSPESTVLFIPYLLFKFEVAAVLHYCVILVCTVGLFLNLTKLCRASLFPTLSLKYPSLLLWPAFLFSIVHLVREFHLGNVNVILVYLISATLLATIQKKYITAGILISIVIFTKPYFIVLLLGFLLIKKLKPILVSAIFGLSAILLFSLITGFGKSIQLHADWLKSMLDHSNYLTSNHTIFSLLENYFGVEIPLANSPLYLFAIGLVLFFTFWIKKTKNEPLRFIFFMLIYLALIPNMIISDTEHFLFAIPLLVYLTYAICASKQFWWFAPFLLVLFMFGGNANDLLGKTLSDFVDQNGLLGISNLIIIVASGIVGFKTQKTSTINSSTALK